MAAGCCQPRVALLEGRFWAVTWSGYDASRIEMPPGSWLVEGKAGGVSVIPADALPVT